MSIFDIFTFFYGKAIPAHRKAAMQKLPKSVDAHMPGTLTGWTELHEAAAQGNLKKTQRLIARQMPVNAKDHIGRTPLHYAAQEGFVEITATLIRAGADQSIFDLTERHLTPEQCAADAGYNAEYRAALLQVQQSKTQEGYYAWQAQEKSTKHEQNMSAASPEEAKLGWMPTLIFKDRNHDKK